MSTAVILFQPDYNAKAFKGGFQSMDTWFILTCSVYKRLTGGDQYYYSLPPTCQRSWFLSFLDKLKLWCGARIIRLYNIAIEMC